MGWGGESGVEGRVEALICMLRRSAVIAVTPSGLSLGYPLYMSQLTGLKPLFRVFENPPDLLLGKSLICVLNMSPLVEGSPHALMLGDLLCMSGLHP